MAASPSQGRIGRDPWCGNIVNSDDTIIDRDPILVETVNQFPDGFKRHLFCLNKKTCIRGPSRLDENRF